MRGGLQPASKVKSWTTTRLPNERAGKKPGARWVTLKHLLPRRPTLVPKPSLSGVDEAQPCSPIRALSCFPHCRAPISCRPTTDGRDIRLRRIPEPDAAQKSLLHQPALSLRKTSRSIQNVVQTRR